MTSRALATQKVELSNICSECREVATANAAGDTACCGENFRPARVVEAERDREAIDAIDAAADARRDR